MERHVLLNSGGMDSFLVAESMIGITESVFVDIGQPYVDKERESALRIARWFGMNHREMKGAQIGQFEHSPSGIIPLRNAELILCAGQYGNHIHLGILANEVNSDKSPEFLRAMETLMTISCRPQYWSEGRDYRIHTPLGTRSKAKHLSTLWEHCDRNASDPNWLNLLQTVSCYDGGELHCGRCPSCFKRWVALTVAVGWDAAERGPNGEPPMTVYRDHPADQHPVSYWEKKGYSRERIDEIRIAYRLAKRS